MASLNECEMRITLRVDVDVVRARQAGARLARRSGMGLQASARLDLVIAELATNVVRHAGRGVITLTERADTPAGVFVCCRDQGNGLDGPSEPCDRKKKGLGLGLGVVQELANEVHIYSEIGKGTRVEVAIWD